jgi:hypothetical protein
VGAGQALPWVIFIYQIDSSPIQYRGSSYLIYSDLQTNHPTIAQCITLAGFHALLVAHEDITKALPVASAEMIKILRCIVLSAGQVEWLACSWVRE